VWLTVAFLEPDFEMPDGRGHLFDVLDRAAERGIDVRAIFWRSPETPEHAHFPGSEAQRALLRERGARFAARWDALPGDMCHHQKSWLVDAGSKHEIAFVGGINLDKGSVSPPGHGRPERRHRVHDVYLELRQRPRARGRALAGRLGRGASRVSRDALSGRRRRARADHAHRAAGPLRQRPADPRR
jgi:phosphatidylserine/phosphatidylglycerophosphate/cardiolipin synthase-like enzyme